MSRLPEGFTKALSSELGVHKLLGLLRELHGSKLQGLGHDAYWLAPFPAAGAGSVGDKDWGTTGEKVPVAAEGGAVRAVGISVVGKGAGFLVRFRHSCAPSAS